MPDPETTDARALDTEWFVEDGFLVSGTQDAHLALASALDDEWIDSRVEQIDMAQRNDLSGDPQPDDVWELGDWCHTQLAAARPGWWRWDNIPDDERDGDATKELRPAEPTTPGAFEAVVFP